MYRVYQIKLPINHSEEDILKNAAVILGIKENQIKNLKIFRRSLDARKEQLHYVYAVDVETSEQIRKKFKPNEVGIVTHTNYTIPKVIASKKSKRPVIVGMGPAGLFCAYVLAHAGLNPLCIERGQKVSERSSDVEKFFKTGKINPDSNVCFGEGGAGTFSDGKLNTLIKDKENKGKFVLETFIKFGANDEILYESKPHIGTDCLISIIEKMRNDIIDNGGEVHFSSKLSNLIIEENELKAITVNNDEKIDVSRLVLATGHSARDTFEMLKENGIPMEPKAYAMGVRVIHEQSLINDAQYGKFAKNLPPASYKVTHTCKNGRGVYSFCMCPGGYVVNASGGVNETLVNGMSYSKRDGKYANSAIVCTVNTDDFINEGFGNDPLSGMYFQQKYERIAYKIADGKIPVQYFKDFSCSEKSDNIPNDLPIKGLYTSADIRKCLPEFISESIVEGMNAFDSKINGFANDKVILCGIETRTSSPVRITRDSSNLQSAVKGIYPCGEGAGYAGGIMSAALDGIKTAEQIIKEYLDENTY